MALYLVRVEHWTPEVGYLDIEASTPDGAIAKATAMYSDGDIDWSEVDGGGSKDFLVTSVEDEDGVLLWEADE